MFGQKVFQLQEREVLQQIPKFFLKSGKILDYFEHLGTECMFMQFQMEIKDLKHLEMKSGE